MTVKRLPPTKTPREVLDLMNDLPLDGKLVADGFEFVLDAPAMCSDRSYFYPIAVIEGDEEATWYPSGEPGDPITNETTWVEA
jgi:hypothetical protein